MKDNKMLDEAIIDYKELKQLIEGYVNDTKSSNIVSLLSEILKEDVNTQKDTKEIEESENKDATTQNRIVDIEMNKEIEESENKDATTQNTNNDEFEVSDIVALIKQEINKEKEVNMKNENEQVLESLKNIIKESLKELMNDKKQIKETDETVEVEDINEDEDIKIYDDEITEDEDITINNDEIEESHGVSLSNNKLVSGNKTPPVDYATYKKNKLRKGLQESENEVGNIDEVDKITESYEKRINLLSESYKKAKIEANNNKKLNEEYKNVLVKYRNQLNEMVLYNTKISHINNILVNENLNDDDKINMLKQFDKATNVDESEKVYQTLTESFKKEKEVNLNETLKNDMTNVVQTNTTKKLIGEAVESGAYKNDSHINKIKKMFNYMDNK